MLDHPRYRRTYKDEAGEWLRGLAPWTTFGTLTFSPRFEKPDYYAAHRAFKKYARDIATRVAHNHVWVAWAYGKQKNGFPHFHVLLAFTPALAAQPGLNRALEDLWFETLHATGIAQFRRFDARRRAGEYLAGHTEIDANVACPRINICRRTRCRQAPSPL